MSGSTVLKALRIIPALVLVATRSPVQAACFESGVGCTDDHRIPEKILGTLSCDALWTVRNSIYHENGYCFKTTRGEGAFSNDGCYVTDVALIKLNTYERANVKRIVAVERAKGCR